MRSTEEPSTMKPHAVLTTAVKDISRTDCRSCSRTAPLLFFTAAITLFHFANAAMLPLIGEKLSQSHQQASSRFIAACIITAQIVMVPMAILVGHKVDVWGRKPIFLAGFAVCYGEVFGTQDGGES